MPILGVELPMAQSSTIEWTQSTWNPVVGCTKVSAGCTHCYAERMAKRLASMATSLRAQGRDPGRKAPYLDVIDERGRWNGRVALSESALLEPARWKSPRVIFVNSMSDLFHPDVPTDFIQRVFAVMNECRRHTFQVLTKRPERAAELSAKLGWTANIWMGTSVEDINVVHRVRALQKVAAKVRFLSVEPLLGPLPRLPLSKIHWVIAGGESGPGARAMEVEWVRQIRDRCAVQGVPFFFKQWGGVNKKKTGRLLDGRTWDQMPLTAGGTGGQRHDRDRLMVG